MGRLPAGYYIRDSHDPEAPYELVAPDGRTVSIEAEKADANAAAREDKNLHPDQEAPPENPPADNPAEQIGEAAEAVEEAAAETAEAVAEAGDPDTATALEMTVLMHLEAAVEQLRAAQEVTEEVAEQTEVATPPDTPEGDQAEEAVETTEEADEAVAEAETAVREVARDAVHPSAEHPYYRERSVFRRGRNKEQTQ